MNVRKKDHKNLDRAQAASSPKLARKKPVSAAKPIKGSPKSARAPEPAENEPAEPSSPVCYLHEFEDWWTGAMEIRLKRAYEPASPEDGERYLVDRLWPRGARKESLALTGWLKDVAPSDELRRWFGHDPRRWPEFRRRYRAELKANPAALQPLREALKRGPVTLVYAAHDEAHNQAVVLREFLSDTKKSPPTPNPSSQQNA